MLCLASMSGLTAIDEGVWVAAAPQTFMGLHVGTRMTVVRLPTGGLWVCSPIALSDELRGELDDLGPVEHVVGPNKYHHLHLGEYVEAYPEARLHGAPGLADKRPDLRFDGELGDDHAPWGPSLEPVHVGGTLLRETVFVHPATRTLVATDLLENFETSEHLLTRLYLKLGGIHGKPGVSRPLRWFHRERSRARAGVDRILERDFERIVICHGDVIERDGPEILRSSYAWL